ncbi:MAG: NAD(P)/FAD-dependent oxidoreductase [Candidatus Dormibacteraeota bacterium]|nr:NAD(P)/FAD-dependent oxidoreductase [Candidatus Dormibacteraeota bacterium]
MADRQTDAVVVGAGPNGLAAAIVLAQAGRSVRLLEGTSTVGGGGRSAELTLPGFVHDVCSAIHPLAAASPFFRSNPLAPFGMELIQPDAPLAHPFDDGTAVIVERSVAATARQLGRDASAYARIMTPLVRHADTLFGALLSPLRPTRHPLVMAGFGLGAIQSATMLARLAFKEEKTRTMFAGLGGHSMVPLNRPGTGAFSLVLGMAAHAVGWPLVRGGSGNLVEAMARLLTSLGGEIQTDTMVEGFDQLPAHRAALFDVTPRQLVKIAGGRFSPGYRKTLERYRYGPGVFKVDWALDGPIPWRAAECARAGTVHLAGSLSELADAEGKVGRGEIPERPFVLVAQQSLFDQTRAPAGKHTGWAYCHVPNGSTEDMTARIESQIERFAPGFRNRILARHVMAPADYERYNPNDIGGDINGGLADLRQLFTRPSPRLYRTTDRQIYICSASTPPSGGVHGMCGYHAARSALRHARWQ